MKINFLIIFISSFLLTGCLIDGVETSATLNTENNKKVALKEGYYSRGQRPLKLEYQGDFYKLGPDSDGNSDRFNIYQVDEQLYIETEKDEKGLSRVNRVEIKTDSITMYSYEEKAFKAFAKQLNNLGFTEQIYAYACDLVTFSDDCYKYNVMFEGFGDDLSDIHDYISKYISDRYSDYRLQKNNEDFRGFIKRYGYNFLKNNKDAKTLNFVMPLNQLRDKYSSNLQCITNSKKRLVIQNDHVIAASKTESNIILLVHGLELTASNQSYKAIKDRQKENWSEFIKWGSNGTTVVCQFVWDSKKGLYEDNEVLQSLIYTLSNNMKDSNGSKLLLIGHSQGGNYIKNALSQVKYKVTRSQHKEVLNSRVLITTLATPHYGTQLANNAALGYGVSFLTGETNEHNLFEKLFEYLQYTELRPNSKSLTLLESNSKLTDIKNQTLTIHAKNDIIVPRHSALWGRNSYRNRKAVVVDGDHHSIQKGNRSLIEIIFKFAKLKR